MRIVTKQELWETPKGTLFSHTMGEDMYLKGNSVPHGTNERDRYKFLYSATFINIIDKDSHNYIDKKDTSVHNEVMRMIWNEDYMVAKDGYIVYENSDILPIKKRLKELSVRYM